MFDKHKKMGGRGKIVQIDESLFQGKHKYNRGRLRNGDIISNVDDNVSSDADDIDDDHSTQRNYGTRIQGPWIFGMCCKNVDGVIERRFFKVEKRDKATLLPIIQNEIELGSIIYSDQWRAYSTLKDIGYHHETVNHFEFFVDPTTGAQTQTIECIWRHVKTKYGIKTRGATDLLDRQLIEEWWRSINTQHDLLEVFWNDIKIVYDV